MKTKAKIKTATAKPVVAKKCVKRDWDAKSGEELERYWNTAKKIGGQADKKYVEIKKKVKNAAKDMQEKAEDVRDRAAKKIDDWLE